MRERIRDFFLAWAPSALVVFMLKKSVLATKYKQQRESSVFFNRANVAYGLRKRFQLRQHTTTAFRLLGDDFAGAYRKFILATVLETFETPSARQRLSGEVIEATRAIGIESADATGWYQLSRGLCAFGFLRAAWYARENSLDLSIQEGKRLGASITQCQRAIEASIERKDLESAIHLVDTCRDQLSNIYLNDLKSLFSLVNWRLISVGSNSDDPENFELFKSLVGSKTVALIGPGSPSGDFGAQIDCMESVIRIKFLGREYSADTRKHGTRCDATYFGNTELEAIEKNFSDFEFRETFGAVKIFLSFNSKLTIRGIPVFNMATSGLTYRTPAYAGIRALYSVLKALPAKLSVFGFDFYAGEHPYSLETRKFLADRASDLGHSGFDISALRELRSFYRVRDLFVHDAVSNFCFVQNLYQAGLFEIEPVGKSILELTPYQYVERLEKMLGDW